jgi:hypothetical protein
MKIIKRTLDLICEQFPSARILRAEYKDFAFFGTIVMGQKFYSFKSEIKDLKIVCEFNEVEVVDA